MPIQRPKPGDYLAFKHFNTFWLIFKYYYLKAPLSLENRQRHYVGDSDMGSKRQGERRLVWTVLKGRPAGP